MEQSKEAEAVNEFDDFQRSVSEHCPENKILEYYTLKLVSEVGQIANEVAHISRGDYESKGIHIHEAAIERLMTECTDSLRYLSLISTAIEKKLSTVIEHGRKQHNGGKNG